MCARHGRADRIVLAHERAGGCVRADQGRGITPRLTGRLTAPALALPTLRTRVEIDGGTIQGSLRGEPKGERAVAAIRPDDLVPVRAGQGGIAAVIEAIEYRGREFHGLARTAAGAELHFSSPTAIAVGTTVSLAANPEQVLIFDAGDA